MTTDFIYEAFANEDSDSTETVDVKISISSVEDAIDALEGDPRAVDSFTEKLQHDVVVYDTYAEGMYGLPETPEELDELVRNVNDNFYRYVDDYEEFGYEVMNELHNISEQLEPYINFEAFGRDYCASFTEIDGYLFNEH